MADKISLQLTPESKKKIESMAKAGKIDLRPTLKVVSIGYRKEVKGIFSKQQPRSEGLRWAPLSEPYSTHKERKYPGNPILVKTGALRLSMTIKGHPANITLISKNSAILGTSLAYAAAHDEGTSTAGRSRNVKIPQRNFSEPSEKRINIWKDQIAKDIKHNFEKEGLEVKGDIFA